MQMINKEHKRGRNKKCPITELIHPLGYIDTNNVEQIGDIHHQQKNLEINRNRTRN